MAFGAGTINSFGSAVNDLFSADTHRARAKGLALEAENYDRSAAFSLQNEQFTKTSTDIKQHQLDREAFKSFGGTQADVAGAGFAESGSALDILRDSASQAALTRAVAGEQGLITEQGYEVEAENFRNMSAAARVAQDAENQAADRAPWLAGIHAAAAVASIFTK